MLESCPLRNLAQLGGETHVIELKLVTGVIILSDYFSATLKALIETQGTRREKKIDKGFRIG